MLKCPFCNFSNEDGSLFCEQCKSDLGLVASAAAPPAMAEPPGMQDAIPLAAVIEEAIPMAAVAVGDIQTPIAVATASAPTAPIASAVASPPPAPDVPFAEAVASAPAAPPPAVATAAAPAAPVAEGARLAPDAKPKLVVLRGQKINQEFPIYDGLNFIGRADEKPVDIDLEDQEPPDRVWCSRQHALISLEEGILAIEDLNSANGTYVNRSRIYPGQKRQLSINDVIQIGTVQLKVRI